MDSDGDSDLESDLESGLVYETSSKVINHQLEKLKEASKELKTEVEVLLRNKTEFKNHLQQQVNLTNLPVSNDSDSEITNRYKLGFYNNVQHFYSHLEIFSF